MRRTRSYIFALCALLLVAGCSHLSVRHLNRQPWVLNTAQTLEMRFWSFEFEAVPMNGQFGVRGMAHPKDSELPPEPSRVEDLWLAAYLCDARGRVLAEDIAFYVPQNLDRSHGVAFNFILKPGHVEAGPLFITFGYRMVLAPPAGEPGASPFFASEGALERL